MTSTTIESDLNLYRRALAGAAQLVALHGDEFLPAYVALETEVDKAQSAVEARNRALQTAEGSTEKGEIFE